MSETTPTPASEVLRPFTESAADAGAERLRNTMAAQGYLFFRRLVPAEDVLAVRRAVLELCRDAGWLDPTRDLLDAVVAPGMQPTTEGRPPYMAVYRKVLSVDTYSCWTPLGACPIALGGLAVWPGSHTRGFLDHSVHHPGAVGGSGVPVDPAEAIWHTTDFEPGDALFFHAFTIHKALPNLSGDRLRLSTDNRYQREGDAIDPGALLPHFNLS